MCCAGVFSGTQHSDPLSSTFPRTMAVLYLVLVVTLLCGVGSATSAKTHKAAGHHRGDTVTAGPTTGKSHNS